MKLYFTNESKIFFQHMALATFQVLSNHMWLVALVLYAADLWGVEDLRMGILWKVYTEQEGRTKNETLGNANS